MNRNDIDWTTIESLLDAWTRTTEEAVKQAIKKHVTSLMRSPVTEGQERRTFEDAASAAARGESQEKVRDLLWEAYVEPAAPLLETRNAWQREGGWPAREWIIPGWMPLNRAGMIGGRGARGKSRLILQMAARIAAAAGGTGMVPLLGDAGASSSDRGVTRRSMAQDGSWASTGPSGSYVPLMADASKCGPVVYASWEDEEDEFGRKLESMEADGLVDMAQLSNLHYLDMAGEGPVWGPGGSGHILNTAEMTLLGGSIRATCEHLGAKMLVLDPLAAAYGSDENAKPLVRGFVSSWDAWSRAAGCTSLIIAHPSKQKGGSTSGGEDNDYSGNTDWHGSMRFRWSLDKLADKPPGEHRDIYRLNDAKSSYGAKKEPIFLVDSPSGLGWLEHDGPPPASQNGPPQRPQQRSRAREE